MPSTITPGRAKPVQVRLRKNLLEAIESWRREQESIPSRPEAIRELVRKSLNQPSLRSSAPRRR
jgi:metal-responsive CopG/Arc/MetJ family transcriptional regulator